jgi:hypothetical protein
MSRSWMLPNELCCTNNRAVRVDLAAAAATRVLLAQSLNNSELVFGIDCFLKQTS